MSREEPTATDPPAGLPSADPRIADLPQIAFCPGHTWIRYLSDEDLREVARIALLEHHRRHPAPEPDPS